MQFLHRSSGSSRNSFEESKSVDKENEKVHLNKDNTSRLFPLTSLSLFHNIWSPMAASTSNSLYRQPSFSSLRSDSSKLFGDGSQQQQEASSSMNQFWHSAENFLASSFDHAMKLESSSSFAPIRKMDESESCDLLQGEKVLPLLISCSLAQLFSSRLFWPISAIAVETDQHNNKAEQIRTDFENNGRDLDLDDGVTFDPFSFSSPTFSRQIDDQPTRYTKGPATYNRRQQYMKTPENPVTSKNKLSKVKKYKYSLNNVSIMRMILISYLSMHMFDFSFAYFVRIMELLNRFIQIIP